MTTLAHRPRFSYGAGPTILNLLLPMMLWESGTDWEGGGDISTPGVPERYVIRRDELAFLRVRFYESEYAAVRAFAQWAMEGSSAFDFRFDQDVPATQFSVYLHAPTLNEGFRPTRDARFPGVWEWRVTLRSLNGTPLYVSF